MAYATYTDIEAFLNITLTAGGQSLVTTLIAEINAFVDNYCNRTWTKEASEDITETFDGGTDKYFVDYPPIASVTSVTTGITSSYSGDVLSEDDDEFYVYDTYVRLAVPASNTPRSVQIVYRTSATALPADLKLAIVRWVAEIFKSQDSAGKSVKRVTTGPMTVEYLTKDGIPDYVLRVLNRYKLKNI